MQVPGLPPRVLLLGGMEQLGIYLPNKLPGDTDAIGPGNRWISFAPGIYWASTYYQLCYCVSSCYIVPQSWAKVLSRRCERKS